MGINWVTFPEGELWNDQDLPSQDLSHSILQRRKFPAEGKLDAPAASSSRHPQDSMAPLRR